jgi:hypothetical protein
MKLTTLLVASSFFAASAFGVSPSQTVVKSPAAFKKLAFRKDSAATSPLFRDPTVTRGGAVPGWAAYNDALDKNPLIAKACTSLVGWALGDLLAQVRTISLLGLYVKIGRF